MSDSIRIVVAGGRDFQDYGYMKETLNGPPRNSVLDGKEIVEVFGMALGANTLGERYAEEYRHGVMRFPADWKNHGHQAGFRRNE